jgi:hypothetical protein
LAEAGGSGEDEVALADHFEGGGEVGDAEGDTAFLALCLENAVDDAGTLAAWRDEDVIEARERFEGEAASGKRGVVGSSKALEGISEEGSGLELRVDLGAEVEGVWVEEHWVDREVDVAGFEAIGQTLRCGDNREIDARCLLGEAL